MRLLILILALIAGSAEARFPRGTPLTNQITCDLVTGVASVGGPCTSGATCDGSADTAPAFWAFRTWALANQGSSNQVVLYIPSGSDCVFNTNAGNSGGGLGGVQNTFVTGINNLIVEGTGATITQGAASFWLGAYGVCQAGLASAGGCSARIQSASPGATTVTLTSDSLSAGYVSRFTTGDWIMLGGLDVQGQWNFAIGFPPNQTYFEWRQITNVNAGTGVITLDRPITNEYLDTWPNYNSGTNFEADNGGAATIWRLGTTNAPWNVSLEYRGLTINTSSGQIYANGRNVTYRNVAFTGAGKGAIPTQNETFSAYDTTWQNTDIEVDKLIGTITLDNVSMALLQFQSNSVDRLIIRNSTFSNTLDGSAKSTEITDTTFGTLKPGSYAYGNTPGPFVCTRCDATTFQANGIAQADNPSPYSMSGGVISFPNTAATGSGPAQRWASTIGKYITWSTNSTPLNYSSIGNFQVLGVTQDATNTYVQTNQAGGFPTFSNFGGDRVSFGSLLQNFTCDDCTGDARMVAMNVQNGCPAAAPLYTCSVRAYTPSATGGAGQIYGTGKLVSLTINVTVASTSSGSLTLNPTGQFINPTVKQSDWTNWNWFPTINLKQAGERIITPGGVTCDGAPGACSGDTINGTNGYPPEAVWEPDGLFPFISGTMNGTNPQFTMTLLTDQTP